MIYKDLKNIINPFFQNQFRSPSKLNMVVVVVMMILFGKRG